MRRWRNVAINVTTLICVGLAGVATAQDHHRPVSIICDQKATGPESVKALIRCVAPKLGVSTSKALYIAYRESHYQPGAHNPNSSACGVFQVVSGTWSYFVNTYLYGHRLGSSYCENGRMNVVLSLRYVRHHGWGPWGG